MMMLTGGALTGNKTGEKNIRQLWLFMHVLVGTKVLCIADWNVCKAFF